MNRDRWQRLMAAFALPESNETFEQLVDAYSQKHRHYHTGVHIEHCLRQLDSASGLAQEPSEVELALWFHDVVYDPYSSDNEAKSADLASELLSRHGVSGARVERVRTHIMATRHEAPAVLDDSKLLVDVDLSILGVDEAAYATFEKSVREEYRWVPGPLFRRNLTAAIAALRGE